MNVVDAAFSQAIDAVTSLLAEAKAGQADGLSGDYYELLAPHDIYTLSYDAVLRRDLKAAEFAGRGFLLTADGQIAGAVDIPEDGTGAILQPGTFETSMAKVFRGLSSASNESIRQLRINSLYLWLIWVTDTTGDYFTPLEPAPDFVAISRRYATDELFDLLIGSGIAPFTVPR